MSNTDVEMEDIVGFFKKWGRSTIPRTRPVDGFVDWAHTALEKTATELDREDDETILSEIAYSFIQVGENYDLDEEDVIPAAQEFVNEYREELIEGLEEAL
jgi:hypothetical protein